MKHSDASPHFIEGVQVRGGEGIGYVLHAMEENEPNFYFYGRKLIEDDIVYDFVCADYDCQTMQPAFSYLHLADTYYPYPSVDSTQAWALYVGENMPCSESCPC